MSKGNGTCRGCGKPVFFAVDELGTRQVLDAVAPVYIVSSSLFQAELHVARHASAYVSHFATCPAADHFSASKRCTCGHTKGEHADGAEKYNTYCSYTTCTCHEYEKSRTRNE